MTSKLLLRIYFYFHFLDRRCRSKIFRNHLLSQRQEPLGSTRRTGIESNRGELLAHVIRHPCDRWMKLITSWCDHTNIITWDSHEYLDSRGNSQHCRNSLALPLGWEMMVGWQFMGRRPTSVNQLRRVWARRLEHQLTDKCVLLDDLVPKIADSRRSEKVKVRQLRKDPG